MKTTVFYEVRRRVDLDIDLPMPEEVRQFFEREMARIETNLYRDLFATGTVGTVLRLTPEGPSFGFVNWDSMTS